MTTAADRKARWTAFIPDLSRWYLPALGLLTAVAIAEFAWTDAALSRERVRSQKLTLTASLGTVSQRIGLVSAQLAEGRGDPDELAALRDVFVSAHQSARFGSASSGLPAFEHPDVLAVYGDTPHLLGRRVATFVRNIDRALDLPPGAQRTDTLRQIEALALGDLMASFDHLIQVLETLSVDEVLRVRWTGAAIFGATLVLIVASAAVVFRPLAVSAKQSKEVLDRTRDELAFRRDHDVATGLPNRSSLREQMCGLLARAQREGTSTAVLLFDLDSFRSLNDRMGPAAGDAVLRAIGARLRGGVRASDLVARVGGDEFCVVLAPAEDVSIVEGVANRLRAQVAQPVSLGGIAVTVSASVGVAVTQASATSDGDVLLLDAEMALADGRRAGSCVRFFDGDMRRELDRRQTIGAELDRALERREIVPFFQPQLDLSTGRVTGFEALARWRHPERGILSPAHFLDVAEATGRTERLGEAILEASLDALLDWDAAGLEIGHVGVNFSSSQLQNPDLIERIKWAVDRRGVDPSRVGIEVLETVIVERDDHIVVRNLRGLARLGFTIDMDDFGTGHASISNLRRFQVDRIKIDRAFVANIHKDDETREMTAAMIGMARALGIETLAEGVECADERAVLAQLGCRFLQGYGIARPMPFDDTVPWLAEVGARLAATLGPLRSERQH